MGMISCSPQSKPSGGSWEGFNPIYRVALRIWTIKHASPPSFLPSSLVRKMEGEELGSHNTRPATPTAHTRYARAWLLFALSPFFSLFRCRLILLCPRRPQLTDEDGLRARVRHSYAQCLSHLRHFCEVRRKRRHAGRLGRICDVVLYPSEFALHPNRSHLRKLRRLRESRSSPLIFSVPLAGFLSFLLFSFVSLNSILVFLVLSFFYRFNVISLSASSFPSPSLPLSPSPLLPLSPNLLLGSGMNQSIIIINRQIWYDLAEYEFSLGEADRAAAVYRKAVEVR